MRQLLVTTPAAEVKEALVAGGWTDLLDADAAVATSVLAEEQGASMSAGASLDLVMLHGAGLAIDPATAVVLPPLGDRDATAARVDGLVLGGGRRALRFLVPSSEGPVSMAVDQLELRPVKGADPGLELQRATGALHGELVASAADWDAALAAGRRFLAAELIGLTQRMLDDTVVYVVARHQFGRPIASFQTVKHRLADVAVSLGAARAGLDTAWSDLDPLSAMAAKALAGRANASASTHCHQVHGGIAFTVEHGFHRFIRRGQVLDGLLGSAAELTTRIGRCLLDERRVPRTPAMSSQEAARW
jgi:alkylation response protein AidB-like acyl-CoA dehydrogenase